MFEVDAFNGGGGTGRGISQKVSTVRRILKLLTSVCSSVAPPIWSITS